MASPMLSSTRARARGTSRRWDARTPDRGLRDARGEIAFAARDHHGGLVAAFLVVAKRARQVRRVDDDDGRGPDVGDRDLREELLVGAVAGGADHRVAFGLPVFSLHFVLGHPEPP